jgi:hypothetical protein
MKQKQFAALALAAWLGVVGWVGSMILAKPQAFPAGFSDTDDSLAAQIQLEIQQSEQVGAALTALEAPKPALASASIIALTPAAPSVAATAAGGATTTDGVAAGAPAERVVSFILSGAGLASRAMIDGVLVGAGARLGDGAVVRSIGPRTVVIRDAEGVLHTLTVRAPGEEPTPAGATP